MESEIIKLNVLRSTSDPYSLGNSWFRGPVHWGRRQLKFLHNKGKLYKKS
jgi:hypothetical protein